VPDNVHDTRAADPVPPFPPGFSELPVEEQILIQQCRGNPEAVQIYTMVKVAKSEAYSKGIVETCRATCETNERRFKALERFKWILSGGIFVLAALKAWIMTRVFGK
jgi:hypothetical protein